jgi:uncharacterized protein (TIGR02679 family)
MPPGLERALERAAARRERRGQFGDAKVALDPLTPQEADALDGLPWPGREPRFISGQPRTIRLLRFEASLEAAGLFPTALYEEALGRPLRDMPAERRARRVARDAFRQAIIEDPRVAERPALRAWLESALSSGRLSVRDADLVTDALQVVERLPAEPPVDRAVLAADLFDGRPHALDADKPLGRLARSMLAACHGIDDDARPRAAWDAAGVEVDPTSTTVLTLGLAPLGDEPIEVALRAQLGRHVVLTLGQLAGAVARWPPGDVFVCENPSVVRAAERALGTRSAPLVCGAGWPTDAVRLLLEQLQSAGATIHYHGDFDLTGIAIFRLLERELHVRRWRYDADAFAAALSAYADRDLPRVGTAAADTAGDLEVALATHDREVPEELVINELLLDLATTGSSSQRARLHDPVRGRG